MLKKLKSKKRIRNEMLLLEFEKGRVLHVDDNIDNKEYLNDRK